LRLQDLSFTTDGFVVAAPLMADLGRALQYPLLFGVLLAALLMGHALVAGLVDADAEVRRSASPAARGLDFRSATIGIGVLAFAALIASVSTIGSGLLLAEGFALLAAGIFVPVVLGLHWRHMNSAGAIAAMLVGAVVAGGYLVGVHLWPVEFFRIFGDLSDAGLDAAETFTDLDMAFAAATDPNAQAAARTVLRQHAATIANWFGLKPAAIVLLAVPLAFAVAIPFSLLFRRRKAPEAAG
jgi:Na+(H+)/acetate symporter ActP